MTEKVRLQSLIDTRSAIPNLQKELDAATETLRTDLAEKVSLIQRALDFPANDKPPAFFEQWKPFMAAIDAFVKGGSIGTFAEQVRQIGAANPALNDVAKALTEQSKTAEEAFNTLREESDWVKLLGGQMSDAAFNAKYFTGQQQAVADASKNASKATADTAKQVESLGKTITVHGSGAKGPVKSTFELVDGVAKAVEKSKGELDDLTTSADQAKTKVSDLSRGIVSVPEELKGKQTPADALTGGLDEASQAVQSTFSEVPEHARAAVDGVVAETARLTPAITAALAGGQSDKKGEQQEAVGIAAAMVKPFEDAKTRIAEVLASLPLLITEAVSAITTAASEFGAGFGDALASPFQDMSDRITSILTSLASTVDAKLNAMIASVQSAVARMRQAVSEIQSLSSKIPSGAGGRGGGGGFASGGRVSGPGTGTSDSIMARLSNGEFVLRAAAVRKYGSDLLYALNSLRLPKNFLAGFAQGGAVDFSGVVSRLTDGMRIPQMVPAFAEGGAVSTGGRPINLNIGGETYKLIAPEDVADRLAKHVGRQGLRRAGKVPSWG